MPIHSLDYAFKQHSRQLFSQVLTAQFFGGFLLLIPSFFLREQLEISICFGLFVWGYSAIFAFVWYYGRVRPSVRLKRIRDSLGLLVAIDCAVIVAAVSATGGLVNSHLTGVLLLIPCVMSLIAIKRRVFMLVTLALIVVVSFGMFTTHWFDKSLLAASWNATGFDHYESRFSDGYIGASGIVIVLSIFLILLEKYVVKPRLNTDEWSFNEIILLKNQEYEPLLADEVNRGFKKYKKYLDETNIPDPHLSLVHNPQATFSQAYILANASYHRGNSDDAADIAFVTFASHWIDDCFDAIYAKEILDHIECEEELEHLTLTNVCARLPALGIERMARGILKYAKDRDLVETALFRVVLGGLIQHAHTDVQDELLSLYRKTYKNCGKLDARLCEIVDGLETNLLLATAHTSFGMILGCESPARSEDRPHLDSFACLFDFMLCPLILFHDLLAEMRWEQGLIVEENEENASEGRADAGRQMNKLLSGLEDIGKIAVEELPLYVDQDAVLGHVRAQQLMIVKELYLNLLPNEYPTFRDNYEQTLNEFIAIFAKGRHTA